MESKLATFCKVVLYNQAKKKMFDSQKLTYFENKSDNEKVVMCATLSLNISSVPLLNSSKMVRSTHTLML